jgi:hypothetical protein
MKMTDLERRCFPAPTSRPWWRGKSRSRTCNSNTRPFVLVGNHGVGAAGPEILRSPVEGGRMKQRDGAKE